MSSFIFFNLTEDIRQLMLQEIQSDIDNNLLYISTRLNEQGQKSYPAFLLKAALDGNDESLQLHLDSDIYFNEKYLRQGKPVKMPSNASQLLAQSEFNRFYIRAICLKAISNQSQEVEIYRARESSWSRPDSEDKIGTLVNAQALLEDLRTAIGNSPTILPEINSGLCVKLI